MNSTGFDCARKGASAQPTSGWGGDAFDSGGHPCGLGGDGSRGEKYECWSTRVAERQGSAGTVEGGRGSSESLETPTMLSLSTQSRKQSQSREYTRSVFVVSRTASSFSISTLSQLVVALYVSRACVTRDLIIDQQRRPRFGQRDRGKLEERRLSAEFSSKDREPRDSKDLSTLRLASISIAEKRPETIGSVWK